MSALPLNLAVTTAQGALLAPEKFQQTLIDNLRDALLRDNHPPCLLRAPTGAGKTLMLARVLADVSAERDVVWLWFVPFVNLVAQTLDAIKSNAADLTPLLLTHGRNQDAEAGQVLISTAQAVAKAQWRNKGYNADGDDDTRTLAEWIARARVQGLRLGMIVDEAHIALDKTTEFGKFTQWLNPDYLLMATATPKDQRLLEFLAGAGMSSYESFAVSRSDVVNARLNKQYIEAIIYDLRHGMHDVIDLKRTVLRQAWARNQALKAALANAGIPLTPLLLVQVGNGDKTVEDAERDLIELCNIPPHAIGKHSADAPDPVLMAAIANDSSKEVLIFKQSAGTGFDAPRAFVLASTKVVNDADFAMQFIGRVMRVAAALRARFSSAEAIPASFNTAYIYLADAEAQQGFEYAVAAASRVKSELEGQTEKLVQRQTQNGAIVFSNCPTPQYPLGYDIGLPRNDNAPSVAMEHPSGYAVARQGHQDDLFSGQDDLLDQVITVATTSADIPAAPASVVELKATLRENGIAVYPRKRDARNLPTALKRERRPQMLAMSQLSRTVAQALPLAEALQSKAIDAALHHLRATEQRTELNSRAMHLAEVAIVTDRSALAREARLALRRLPQVEEADIRDILNTLAERIQPALQLALDDARDEITLRRLARDAANWIAKSEADRLAEALHEIIALQAQLEDAGRLPDAMLFPTELPLPQSAKNIYGVMPPSVDTLLQVEQILLPDERKWLRDKEWRWDDDALYCGGFDQSFSLNGEELPFAKALDRSEFVAWWHRNPPGGGKAYAVRLVRGEHKHFFYPDFIVCLEHDPGDEPLIRLIETKQDVKDAARKARHIPAYYGKVLFLTKDQERLRWVKDDGSLGENVDLADLHELRDWLRLHSPDSQNLGSVAKGGACR
ncbi:hypothetical protein JHS3_00930 [Jeongeupia sp. HS-3]|uniref:DEAD/DEAH box helicase n=1 Tax=Jeongeupia sp. HS-3 TaxID=1009682 RepID=UPI0018A3952C|nr:DEAD/DEAH box helicase family protein [Jeongeupia sp. HS-3]BCL74357.1 hypothetical protein JHS3_00930 [Jeongeupia sp. HS-3]